MRKLLVLRLALGRSPRHPLHCHSSSGPPSLTGIRLPVDLNASGRVQNSCLRPSWRPRRLTLGELEAERKVFPQRADRRSGHIRRGACYILTVGSK